MKPWTPLDAQSEDSQPSSSESIFWSPGLVWAGLGWPELAWAGLGLGWRLGSPKWSPGSPWLLEMKIHNTAVLFRIDFLEGWLGLASAGLAWSGLAGASWSLEIDVLEALEARNGALGWPGLAWAGLSWLGLAWPSLVWPGMPQMEP